MKILGKQRGLFLLLVGFLRARWMIFPDFSPSENGVFENGMLSKKG